MITVAEIKKILDEAQQAATTASALHELTHGDAALCGFAWVDIFEYKGEKIKGNTKIGRMLKQAGVRQSYTKTFSQWCNWYGGQNIDIKEAGARAFAEVLQEHGFRAYAGSRLD